MRPSGGRKWISSGSVVREPFRLAARPIYDLLVSDKLGSICALFQDNSSLNEGIRVLSEHDVSRMWRDLFHNPSVTSETVVKAAALLKELKPESPLRHRLAVELAEICDLKKTSVRG